MIKKRYMNIIAIVVMLIAALTAASQAANAQTIGSSDSLQVENRDDNFAYGLFGGNQAILLVAIAILILSVCVLCTAGLIRKK